MSPGKLLIGVLGGAALIIMATAAAAFVLTRQPGDWNVTEETDTIEGYRAFLDGYPDHPRARSARARLQHLRWREAYDADTTEAWDAFAEEFPDHRNPEQVASHRAWAQARENGNRAAIAPFLAETSDSSHADEARVVIARLDADSTIAAANALFAKIDAGSPPVRSCPPRPDRVLEEPRWALFRETALRLRQSLTAAGREIDDATGDLQQGYSDIPRWRNGNAPWHERLVNADRELARRLETPDLVGGLKQEAPTLVEAEHLLQSEARTEVRVRLAAHLDCVIRRTTRANALAAYLDAFPTTSRADDARAALERLEPRDLVDLIAEGKVIASASIPPRKAGVVVVSIANQTDLAIGVWIPVGLVANGRTIVHGDALVIGPHTSKDRHMRSVFGAGGVHHPPSPVTEGLSLLADDAPLRTWLPLLNTMGSETRIAAAWVAVQDRTFEGLGDLRRVQEGGIIGARGSRAITEDIAEHAVTALADAGFDVATRRICAEQEWDVCRR